MDITRRQLIRKSALACAAYATSGMAGMQFAEASVGGLAAAFSGDFMIGTMVSPEAYVRQEPELVKIIVSDFNSLSTDNAFKWDHIHPTSAHWDWVYADEFVKFGQQHNMHLVGHTLVWHSQFPVGLFSAGDGRVSRDVLLQDLESHISTIVERYRDKIHSWDVVNEAISDDGTWFKSPWLQIIGTEYIEQSFRFARNADPNAVLIYNDYNLWHPKKRKAALNMIDDFKRRGVPIDAVGVQGHIGLDYPDLGMLEKTIQDFAATGLRVNISELEIDVLPPVPPGVFPTYSPELDPYRDGLPSSVQNQLASRYAALFHMLLNNKSAIDRVTFWGVSDDQSWKNDFPIEGRTSYPLLFDRKLRPKKAYHEIKNINNS